jgi:fatty-acyl-CoA synthase
MAFAYTAQERTVLNAKASALLSAYPDVGSFISQGLSGNPEAEALVYLRTALDPAPVITKAGDMLGLLARRWLRRNGIGPGDIVSLFAPNCTATSIAYWASMSAAAVQPLNLLFTREAIAAQVNAVKAKMLLTPPPGTAGASMRRWMVCRNWRPASSAS